MEKEQTRLNGGKAGVSTPCLGTHDPPRSLNLDILVKKNEACTYCASSRDSCFIFNVLFETGISSEKQRILKEVIFFINGGTHLCG